MEKKNVYSTPEMEVIELTAEDIIATSNGGGIVLPDDNWN